MSRLSAGSLHLLLEEVCAKAHSYHNNLELDGELFINQVLSIIEKQLQAESRKSAPRDILLKLHTNDLYLTIACGHSIEQGWERLEALYHSHLKKLAFILSGNGQQTDEIAQDTLAHLFMTDKAGNRRIASYQGLSSLATWLTTIVHHRIIAEWQAPFRQFEPLESVFELADEDSMQKVESAARAKQYSQMAVNALRRACGILNERERWFLTLRYEQELRIKQIAEIAKLDPTTIAYHIQRAQERVRKEVYAVLKKEYNLQECAIKECIEEILASPAYSLLNLLKVV